MRNLTQLSPLVATGYVRWS